MSNSWLCCWREYRGQICGASGVLFSVSRVSYKERESQEPSDPSSDLGSGAHCCVLKYKLLNLSVLVPIGKMGVIIVT